MISKDIQYWKDNHESWMTEKPFRYWQIDGMLDGAVLDNIADYDKIQKAWDYAMSEPNPSKRWGASEFWNDLEGKRGLNNVSGDPEIHGVLNYLNSDEFIGFLRHITGIEDLIGDDSFAGGGVHIIPRGGKLGVHCDFSIHDDQKFNGYWRRVNVLLYMNHDWKDEWEGHLELWDKPRKRGGECVSKIRPDFNKMIIFGTSENSWHGHPTPLACPEDKKRISLATYYYSKQPSSDTSNHSTLFAESDDHLNCMKGEGLIDV